MISFILIFILSAIGIIETIYLIRKRIASEVPICLIGGDCGVVLGSKYNKIFIIPNDILGLLTFILILLLAILLAVGVQPISLLGLVLKLTVAGASVMSLFFTYLQWQVIRIWCFWCLMSALTVWLMGSVIFMAM